MAPPPSAITCFALHILLLTTASAASSRTMRTGSGAANQESTCYDPDAAVFPYWSFCQCPAMYEYLGGVYNLVMATSRGVGLAPEEASTDGSAYVRLSDAPAEYVFTHVTKDFRFLVVPGQRLLVKNRATGRFLAWGSSAADQPRLLLETNTIANYDPFTFGLPSSTDDDVALPCPRIAYARCVSYTMLSWTSSDDADVVVQGLSSYVENGTTTTYLTLSDTAILPLVLLQSSSDTSNCTIDGGALVTRRTTASVLQQLHQQA